MTVEAFEEGRVETVDELIAVLEKVKQEHGGSFAVATYEHLGIDWWMDIRDGQFRTS